MAVIRTVTVEEALEIGLEDPDLGGVHFTDELFEEVVTVGNVSDRPVTGTIEMQINTERTLGLRTDPIRTMSFDVDLAPGETHREPLVGVGMVGGAGVGLIVGVLSPEIVENPDTGRTAVTPGEDLIPLVNIVFWDRDFYRANYIWPRRAQYLSVAIAVLSAVLAGTIVWLSIG